MNGPADARCAFAVRPYGPDDLDACAQLYETVMRETFADDDPADFDAALFAEATKGEHIWVATAGEAIVGLATVWLPRSFVHYLLVARTWRGRGVGRRLLQHVIERAHGPVELKCRLDNPPALAFYAALGWREVDRDVQNGHPHVRLRSHD